MKNKVYSIALFLLLSLASGYSQTTLSGNHIVAGATGNSAGTNLKVTGDGGVLFEGTYGTGTFPTASGDTALVWYAKKGAFRVGIYGGGISSNSMGAYSFSSGTSIAGGDYSVAMGSSNYAYDYSVIIGSINTDGGSENAIFGNYNEVFSATNSVIVGVGNLVTANYGTAIGNSTNVGGAYSLALGTGATTGADYSIALGGGISGGNYSIAMGQSTSTSFRSTTLGSFNVVDSGQDTDSWVSADQLVVVGNGTDSGSASNALVMRKNAELRTGSVIQAKGGMVTPKMGDIGMGSFTAGQDPSTLNSALKYSGE